VIDADRPRHQLSRCGSGTFDVRYRFNRGVTVWQGDEGMRIAIVALGTALALCSLGASGGTAHAQDGQLVRTPRERPLIRVPVVKPTPYWDSYLVPRYRYRPEDDRVDPCGGPVVPVITYGNQDVTIPPLLAHQWGLGLVHGRDWPCYGRR
jgi:hypothetical protein